MEVGNLVWRLQFNVSSLSSVQSHSHGKLFATPGTAARQASLFFTISPNLLKLMSIESVMMSNHLIHCHHLLQYFPASESFQISQFFSSGGQSIVVSASASVLPMDIQDWSPLGWTGWISLQSKGLSRVFSNITVQKHHSICWGPKWNKWKRKGKFSLFLSLDTGCPKTLMLLVFRPSDSGTYSITLGIPYFTGLWTQTELISWLSSLQTVGCGTSQPP